MKPIRIPCFKPYGALGQLFEVTGPPSAAQHCRGPTMPKQLFVVGTTISFAMHVLCILYCTSTCTCTCMYLIEHVLTVHECLAYYYYI